MHSYSIGMKVLKNLQYDIIMSLNFGIINSFVTLYFTPGNKVKALLCETAVRIAKAFALLEGEVKRKAKHFSNQDFAKYASKTNVFYKVNTFPQECCIRVV